MRIGVISDNHRAHERALKALDMLLKNGAEFIIHAGDIVEKQTLELLKNCGKRYVCVYGNNDTHLVQYHNEYNLVKEPHYFKLANTKFKLMHLPYYMSPDTEIVIFGHTHHFKSEMNSNTLYLNPGEICAREKPISECVMLEVNDDNFLVTHYQHENGNEKFYERALSYERKKNG